MSCILYFSFDQLQPFFILGQILQTILFNYSVYITLCVYDIWFSSRQNQVQSKGLYHFKNGYKPLILIRKLGYVVRSSYGSVKRCISDHSIYHFCGMHVIPEYVFGSVWTNRSIRRTKFFSRINRTATPITYRNPYEISNDQWLQLLDKISVGNNFILFRPSIELPRAAKSSAFPEKRST